jgi:hypothetical protein
MPELTPEEKKKKKEDSMQAGAGCLVLLIIIGALYFSCSTPSVNQPTNQSTPAPSQIELKAVLNYNNGRFTINNNDSFNWTNVKFKLNDVYKLQAAVIEARGTYTVGSKRFVKDDGTMFDPMSIRPTGMTIWCDTPQGAKGFYYGKW